MLHLPIQNGYAALRQGRAMLFQDRASVARD